MGKGVGKGVGNKWGREKVGVDTSQPGVLAEGGMREEPRHPVSE